MARASFAHQLTIGEPAPFDFGASGPDVMTTGGVTAGAGGDGVTAGVDGVTVGDVFLNVGDHLGSSSFILDHDTSELVERATYQTFGATESDYRPDRWDNFRERVRYTAHEDDAEVGLTYFGKRYYAPAIARFISPDPLNIHALGADPNPYAYVYGSPHRYVDPFGLDPCNGDSSCGPFVGVGQLGGAVLLGLTYFFGGGGSGGSSGSTSNGNRPLTPPPPRPASSSVAPPPIFTTWPGPRSAPPQGPMPTLPQVPDVEEYGEGLGCYFTGCEIARREKQLKQSAGAWSMIDEAQWQRTHPEDYVMETGVATPRTVLLPVAKGSTTFLHGSRLTVVQDIAANGVRPVSIHTAPFPQGSFFTHVATEEGLIASSHWPVLRGVPSTDVGVLGMQLPNAQVEALRGAGLLRTGPVPGVVGFPPQSVFLPGAIPIINQNARFILVPPFF